MTPELAAVVERMECWAGLKMATRAGIIPVVDPRPTTRQQDIRLVLAELERRGESIDRYQEACSMAYGAIRALGVAPLVEDALKLALTYDGTESGEKA